MEASFTDASYDLHEKRIFKYTVVASFYGLKQV